MKKTFLILITNQFSTQGRISAFILDEKSKEPKDLEFKTNADAVKWLKENDQNLSIPKKYKSIPGSIKYRRPEKYSKLVEKDDRAYDFVVLTKLYNKQQKD